MTQSIVAQLFADEWPKIVATLVRELGDVDLAEDAAQQAFIEAADKWGPGNTPDRPGAWLMTTARRRAIDVIRRNADLRRKLDLMAADAQINLATSGWFAAGTDPDHVGDDDHQLVDDQLALIFGCCHPSLNTEAQVALTLRQVCGLSTRQIAAAFLTTEATMAKRLVRAKTKIRDAGVPFTVPDADQLDDRLESVLAVIYLIYTEGHAAADATSLIRGDLCDEARWLADLVADLLPRQPEASSLSALLNLSDARRAARVDEHGQLVLLADQDRSRWDHTLIKAGRERLSDAEQASSLVGAYRLQAEIALAHAEAPDAESTDWAKIVKCYDRLFALEPTAVIALNRAAALSKASGPAAGLAALDALDNQGHSELRHYRYFHAARADMLRQLERWGEALSAYQAALDLTTNDSERQFLVDRIALAESGGEPD